MLENQFGASVHDAVKVKDAKQFLAKVSTVLLSGELMEILSVKISAKFQQLPKEKILATAKRLLEE